MRGSWRAPQGLPAAPRRARNRSACRRQAARGEQTYRLSSTPSEVVQPLPLLYPGCLATAKPIRYPRTGRELPTSRLVPPIRAREGLVTIICSARRLHVSHAGCDHCRGGNLLSADTAPERRPPPRTNHAARATGTRDEIPVGRADHRRPGTVSEDELLPEVASESGWQCAHAIWPAWITGEQITDCGWCRAPLSACEFVTCPWCEWFVPTERVLEHWGGGCEE